MGRSDINNSSCRQAITARRRRSELWLWTSPSQSSRRASGAVSVAAVCQARRRDPAGPACARELPLPACLVNGACRALGQLGQLGQPGSATQPARVRQRGGGARAGRGRGAQPDRAPKDPPSAPPTASSSGLPGANDKRGPASRACQWEPHFAILGQAAIASLIRPYRGTNRRRRTRAQPTAPPARAGRLSSLRRLHRRQCASARHWQ